MSKINPIPQNPIGESFVWREWFQRLSDRVFGSLGNQNADAVFITGGTIDGTTIGAVTPAAGTFTTLTATGQTSLGGAAGSESLRVLTNAGQNGYVEIKGGIYGTSSPNIVARNSGAGAGFNIANGNQGTISFYTNNITGQTPQFRVSHTASAVNYVQVTGAATGGTVAISAQGSDTNIPIALDSKGSSSTFLRAGGLTVFAALRTASSVNYVTARGAIAGNAVELGASGSDTNIDLALTPKGTGLVKFGTYTAAAMIATGYISIKAANGTTYKLLVST